MREISGHGEPVPRGPRPLVVPILIVPPDKPLEVVVVSDSWLGMATHWYRHPAEEFPRTRLCLAPRACICLSEADVPSKWHCYMGVIRWSNFQPGVLSCTSSGISAILDALPDINVLRGASLLLKRAAAHKSARVICEPSPKDWHRPLMPRFSLLPTLESVYGKTQMDVWRELHPQEDGVA